MPNELEMPLSVSLSSASSIITKDYLAKLSSYEILNPTAENIDVDIVQCGKFYRLTKLVVNKDENFLNKLTTIVNVASSIDCSIATVIKSDGYKIDYLIGIVSKNARGDKEASVRQRRANEKAFKGALDGNLIGSEFSELSETEVGDLRDNVLKRNGNCYSSVSGIVALRDDEDKSVAGYVQGIENLVDSLKGQKYTIVMLADPMGTAQIQTVKEGYEILYTELTTFAQSVVTINESDTLSLSKAHTEGISEGISKGIAMTQSNTTSTSKSHGFNAGVGVSFIVSANVGFNTSKSKGSAQTTGQTNTTMETSSKNMAETETVGTSKTAGKSLQLSYENRSVKSMLDKIDKHLERLDECDSFGAFNCAAYVIADDRETAVAVASNYNALMRGMDSSVQSSQINTWHRPEQTNIIAKYMGALVHPRFCPKDNREIVVTPASIISGNELAIQIGLPKKSVAGVTVIPIAPFGRNIVETSNNTIELGTLYHMGHNEGANGKEQKVKLDIQSLTMHTFITGSTGSGKSTTIYSMLDKLRDNGVRFMVIEPAKGEYKNRFGGYNDVAVYGTNNKKMPLLRINPFSFPNDVHVLEHIDRLVDIFNVCWSMYAAMPAVLKDSIERAYEVSGWNLESSECRYCDEDGNALFPTFEDVLNQINVVMNESAYSSDSKGDYKGALCTRLKSLTNGLYRQIFTPDELSGGELFESNVIVDLSRTGSSETKSLIMGLLVLKLQEYRMSNATGTNAKLGHVTVLEEAHNILKRTSTEQSSETANLMGKSVEMIGNSIAEMRTYGEGFIIADQAPGLMDMSVIRNTNTKIILRLPDYEDRELVGRASNLNDEQIVEVSRLENFVAAVYQNNWLEPVLCNIDTNFKTIAPYKYDCGKVVKIDKRGIVDYLLIPFDRRNEFDDVKDKLIRDIFKLPIATELKVGFIRYTQSNEKDEIQRIRSRIIYQIYNSENVFRLAKGKEGNIDLWLECIRDNLEPSISYMDEVGQNKVISSLVLERTRIDGSKETNELFERVMKRI